MNNSHQLIFGGSSELFLLFLSSISSILDNILVESHQTEIDIPMIDISRAWRNPVSVQSTI